MRAKDVSDTRRDMRHEVLENIVTKHVEQKKNKKIQDSYEEVDNLVLNYKIDLESLLVENFEENFVSMTSNFAVCCVTVSFAN